MRSLINPPKTFLSTWYQSSLSGCLNPSFFLSFFNSGIMSNTSTESTNVPQPNPNNSNNSSITDSSKNSVVSESHSIQITTIRLSGDNFLRWSQSVRMYIRGRGKMGYLTGEKKALHQRIQHMQHGMLKTPW